jgi:hypothetical protein
LNEGDVACVINELSLLRVCNVALVEAAEKVLASADPIEGNDKLRVSRASMRELRDTLGRWTTSSASKGLSDA